MSMEEGGCILPRAKQTVDPRGSGSAEAMSPYVFAIVHRALWQFCYLWLLAASVALALVLRPAAHNDPSSALRILWTRLV